MKQFFQNKKFYVFGIITILWMLLIYILSSQNGEQTAKLSLWISDFISRFVGDGTEAAAAQNHMEIRKLAHIGLFLGLGVISYLLVYYGILSDKFSWRHRLSMLIALVFTSGYGYFDEWHKQFIEGRHFQLDEAALNIVSGCVGVLFICGVQFLWQSYKRGRN